MVYSVLFFILILCGFGLPLPEDIVLITGGYLAYEELLNVHVMTAVGLVGVLAGDSIMFTLGRKYGTVLLTKEFVKKIITPDKIKKAQKYLAKYGNRIFFIARFLPGLRSPIFFTGGSLKVPFYIFFCYDALAALLSVPIWVYSAYYGGEYIYKVISIGRSAQAIIFGIIVLFVAIQIYRYYKKRKQHKKK